MEPINGNDFKIMDVNQTLQEEAKEIILNGLAERFGFLDDTLNPDLNDIQHYYIDKGDIFIVGLYHSTAVCTGALTKEDHATGRIERMSVLKAYRQQGLASIMLLELEKRAKELGYVKLVLETNKSWLDAIQFYKKHGFIEFNIDEQLIHMEKSL